MLNFEKLHNENKIKDEIRDISKDEQEIKSKIYGLVWGTALGEINNYYMQSADVKHHTESWAILNSDYSMDWDVCTDITVLAMRTMMNSIPQLDLNPKIFAKNLIDWKTNGFSELADHKVCLDNVTKYVISQPGYSCDPIEVANKVYKSKRIEDASNSSMNRNILNGIFKDYLRRSILSCKLIQPDEACQISCIIHSFIIRSIWDGKYITTEAWAKISNICYKIFDNNKSFDNNVQQKIDFDSYWMIGRNYQYKINEGIGPFISQNLKINNHNEKHTFIPMTIAIIIMYDIQSHIRIDGRLVKDMMNTIEIPIVDDKLREKKIDFSKELPADYYFRQIEAISKINSDNICNATAGSILGLACYNNVYNDLAIKDENGNKIESNSQQWIKYATHKDWLNNEIETFACKYLDVRQKIIMKKNELKHKSQFSHESIWQ